MSKRYIGYTRVSTPAQLNGDGIPRQERAISALAMRNGWSIAMVSEGAKSAGISPFRRPVLRAALEAIGRGEADGLVVESMDRLTRSVEDWHSLKKLAAEGQWDLVFADQQNLDATTPTGELTALIMATLAEMHRQQVQQRIGEAMLAKMATGWSPPGGPAVQDDARGRMAELWASGMCVQAIATRLTEEGFPTARGAKAWTRQTVFNNLKRLGVDGLEIDEVVGGRRVTNWNEYRAAQLEMRVHAELDRRIANGLPITQTRIARAIGSRSGTVGKHLRKYAVQVGLRFGEQVTP